MSPQDPESFELWMNVLRRTPGSVLWMLRPKEEAHLVELRENLEREAAARGVHPSRLVFAERMKKANHLQRHAAADLLLDTLVYGAHSTATDALRGGLPLLTVRGDQFPTRVGLSLLKALDAGQEILAVDSLRDFEQTSVFLTTTPRGRRVLRRLRARLAEDGRGSRLFDTARFTADLERAYHLVWEASAAARSLAHHVVVVDAEAAPAVSVEYRAAPPVLDGVPELPGLWEE